MANSVEVAMSSMPVVPQTVDEARAMARQRFKTRLEAGEKVGDCACETGEGESVGGSDDEADKQRVVGIRFRDSGRTYYFDVRDAIVEIGSWVVVKTGRGLEAGRVVIAPQQIRLNTLQGELKAIERFLSDADVRRMDDFRRRGADAVRAVGRLVRFRGLPVKPITAEYSFDGATLTVSYSTPERSHLATGTLRELTNELATLFDCRVELREVGPRDEARLLGGVGRCGRTLCCSSWLPIYPEISMNMAKTQDLPLNPSKVSGVCGRLLCCLSYENEQYRQMKGAMPRLGQTIATPDGDGVVVSMQILKELITVRLEADKSDRVFSKNDLGIGSGAGDVVPASPERSVAVRATIERPATSDLLDGVGTVIEEPAADAGVAEHGGVGRRRRRRGGGRGR